MGLCVFKTAYIKRCIEHALKATDFRMPFSEEPPKPALLFVHDQGVYLMSNGLPMDNISHSGSSAYVAYAEGCDPKINSNWWEASRALVGGDDFGEILPIDAAWLEKCDLFNEFHIDVTEATLDMYFDKPRRTKKKKMPT